MRYLSLLISLFLVLLRPGYCLAESTQLSIEEGTPVRLKLQEALSTKTSSAGQKVQLVVLEDVLAMDGKTTLVKEGAPAVAYLTNVDEKDGEKGGKLTLEITSVKAIDGTRVTLRGLRAKSGGNGAGVGSYVVGGLCLGLVGLGVVALAKRSKSAQMQAGTIVTAFVDREAMISLAPDVDTNKQIVIKPMDSAVHAGDSTATSVPTDIIMPSTK
jgi:hypothetical protein